MKQPGRRCNSRINSNDGHARAAIRAADRSRKRSRSCRRHYRKPERSGNLGSTASWCCLHNADYSSVGGALAVAYVHMTVVDLRDLDILIARGQLGHLLRSHVCALRQRSLVVRSATLGQLERERQGVCRGYAPARGLSGVSSTFASACVAGSSPCVRRPGAKSVNEKPKGTLTRRRLRRCQVAHRPLRRAAPPPFPTKLVRSFTNFPRRRPAVQVRSRRGQESALSARNVHRLGTHPDH